MTTDKKARLENTNDGDKRSNEFNAICYELDIKQSKKSVEELARGFFKFVCDYSEETAKLVKKYAETLSQSRKLSKWESHDVIFSKTFEFMDTYSFFRCCQASRYFTYASTRGWWLNLKVPSCCGKYDTIDQLASKFKLYSLIITTCIDGVSSAEVKKRSEKSTWIHYKLLKNLTLYPVCYRSKNLLTNFTFPKDRTIDSLQSCAIVSQRHCT